MSDPQVREFMDEREYLRSLGVPRVDKDHGCERVAKGETAKLAHVQFAVGVVSNYAVAEYQYASVLGLSDEAY